jgi:hypothetical protein
LKLLKTLLACGYAAFACATTAFATEHPANGRLINDLPADYGTAAYGFPGSWSHGDLTFGGPYPAAAELLPTERYMLAGAEPTPADGGDELPAWIDSVAGFCLDYYAGFGTIPEQLTMADVQALRRLQGQALTAADNALVLNPLTDSAPRLKAVDFSPGELYVRVLSSDEMRYYAQRRPEFDDAWFMGRAIDPAGGRVGRVQLLSGVLYVRAYGSSGVIYENFAYQLSDPDYSAQPESSSPDISTAKNIETWKPIAQCQTGG